MVAGQQDKTVCIIQARMSSNRFPGKISELLDGKPLLEHVIRQCQAAQSVKEIVVATSTDQSDDVTETLALGMGVNVARGSLIDVRDRFLRAGEGYKFIVRVTADNPLTESSFITSVIAKLESNTVDYVSVVGCPVGTGVQGFTYSLLRWLAEVHQDSESKEHVVLEPILRNSKKVRYESIEVPVPLRGPDVRLTIDTPRDLQDVEKILRGVDRLSLERRLENYIKVYRKL
jgi:spore coat polysaccharide biosynthesis protein SpsF